MPIGCEIARVRDSQVIQVEQMNYGDEPSTFYQWAMTKEILGAYNDPSLDGALVKACIEMATRSVFKSKTDSIVGLKKVKFEAIRKLDLRLNV